VTGKKCAAVGQIPKCPGALVVEGADCVVAAGPKCADGTSFDTASGKCIMGLLGGGCFELKYCPPR
jgi:hypothetical protein